MLVLPSAWVKGPLKEMHWDLLTRTRALENTCYVVAVGECGMRNIGNSMVVDPLGVPISRRPSPGHLFLPSSIHKESQQRAQCCRCWITAVLAARTGWNALTGGRDHRYPIGPET